MVIRYLADERAVNASHAVSNLYEFWGSAPLPTCPFHGFNFQSPWENLETNRARRDAVSPVLKTPHPILYTDPATYFGQDDQKEVERQDVCSMD